MMSIVRATIVMFADDSFVHLVRSFASVRQRRSVLSPIFLTPSARSPLQTSCRFLTTKQTNDRFCCHCCCCLRRYCILCSLLDDQGSWRRKRENEKKKKMRTTTTLCVVALATLLCIGCQQHIENKCMKVREKSERERERKRTREIVSLYKAVFVRCRSFASLSLIFFNISSSLHFSSFVVEATNNKHAWNRT